MYGSPLLFVSDLPRSSGDATSLILISVEEEIQRSHSSMNQLNSESLKIEKKNIESKAIFKSILQLTINTLLNLQAQQQNVP